MLSYLTFNEFLSTSYDFKIAEFFSKRKPLNNNENNYSILF